MPNQQPSWKDRFLAAIDRIFGHDSAYMTEDGGYESSYHIGLGREMLIFNANGEVRFQGRSWWVKHKYDEKGKLVSRTVLRKNLAPGEQIFFGKKRIERQLTSMYGYSPSFGYDLED